MNSDGADTVPDKNASDNYTEDETGNGDDGDPLLSGVLPVEPRLLNLTLLYSARAKVCGFIWTAVATARAISTGRPGVVARLARCECVWCLYSRCLERVVGLDAVGIDLARGLLGVERSHVGSDGSDNVINTSSLMRAAMLCCSVVRQWGWGFASSTPKNE